MSETSKEIPMISFRNILTITYPVVLSMLSVNIMIFVDRTFVAHYNLTQFAAMMPAGSLATAISCIFTGAVSYVSVLIAQYYGARRYSDCSAAMWQGVYLSMFFLVLLGLLSVVAADIFRIMGHDGELVKYEVEYFYLIILANCIQIFSAAFSGFYRGIGDTKIIMYVGVATNVINMVLDWLLIFGNCGLTARGIAGAGLATMISCTIGLVLYAFLLNKNTFKHKYKTLSTYGFDRKLLYKLLKFGSFAGVQAFVETGYFSFLLLIIGKTGEFTLTCANIAFSIEAISILPIIGITTAVGIIAGQERGAKRLDNITAVMKKGMVIGICFNFFIIGLYNLFPEFLISIFTDEQGQGNIRYINAATIPLVRLTSVWLVFDTVYLTIGSVLQSMGDTKFMMLIYATVPFLFYVILPFILCVWAEFSMIWLWIALTGYSIIMAVLVTNRFLGGHWKRISII
ncbi:MATE family efflux transporter [Sporomusa acidovorans]|uniref:Probable multidrug resistance protein NorM n=1 Tax=Sporomusa acidovorans (strain ATCC 49682 / DSM 3132 / Mol) TaxID=1123286 RepID=A0ABZ3IYF1_SPOA4|nr:MATE family efflux transporter [Sporomusa acidovorans]OZC17648.1 multidrug resistance protein NorM [Sporomusa acidovorans DSM 3132]SDE10787.1 multidrug resistance protein, MATE family [Sporomusa acidovorans]